MTMLPIRTYLKPTKSVAVVVEENKEEEAQEERHFSIDEFQGFESVLSEEFHHRAVEKDVLVCLDTRCLSLLTSTFNLCDLNRVCPLH
jgi:hypothetical protein